MSVGDEEWTRTVCATVDPVLFGAAVGFTPGRGSNGSILWEAEPGLFAEKYPDAGLVETYGGPDAWQGVHCIDYWLHAEPEKNLLRVSVEGWDLPEFYLPAEPDWRGIDVAQMFARILGLPSPEFD